MTTPRLPPTVGNQIQLAHARSHTRSHNDAKVLQEVGAQPTPQMLAGLAETYCAHLPYSVRLSNNPLARAGVSHAAGGGAGGVGGAGGSAGAAAGGACGAAAAYGISANDALADPTRIGSTTAAWGSVGGTGEAQAATSAAGGGGGAPGGRDPGAVWPPWRNGEHLAHHFGPAWDSKLAPLTLRDKLDDGAVAESARPQLQTELMQTLSGMLTERASDIKRPQMTRFESEKFSLD